jgi:hypothetical protein
LSAWTDTASEVRGMGLGIDRSSVASTVGRMLAITVRFAATPVRATSTCTRFTPITPVSTGS